MANVHLGAQANTYRLTGPANNFADKQVNLRVKNPEQVEAGKRTEQNDLEDDLQGAIQAAAEDGDNFISLGRMGKVEMRMTLDEAQQLLHDLKISGDLRYEDGGLILDDSDSLHEVLFDNLNKAEVETAFEGKLFVSYAENKGNAAHHRAAVGRPGSEGLFKAEGAGLQGEQQVNSTRHARGVDSGIDFQSENIELIDFQQSEQNGRDIIDINARVDGETVNYQIVSRDQSNPFSYEDTKIYAGPPGDIYEVVKPEERAELLAQVDQLLPEHVDAPRVSESIHLPEATQDAIRNLNLDKVENSGNFQRYAIREFNTSQATLGLGQQGDTYQIFQGNDSVPPINFRVNADPTNSQIQSAYLIVGNQIAEVPTDILFDNPGGSDGVIRLNNEGQISAIHLEAYLDRFFHE